MANLLFLGVGAATDFEQAETSVLYGGKVNLLVDCGPQCPRLLAASLPEPDALDLIYVTHQHGDHCFGLGALLLWLRMTGRKRPLRLCGERSTLEVLGRLLEIGYPGAFLPHKCYPLNWLPMQPGERYEILGVSLGIATTHHNVPCHALRIDDGSVSVAFSGDGVVTEQTIQLYQGCDTLVQECAYAGGEHDHHSTVDGISRILEAATPRQLFLVHCLGEQRARVETLAKERFGDRVVVPRRGDLFDVGPRV